jgi:hypothetical protein
VTHERGCDGGGSTSIASSLVGHVASKNSISDNEPVTGESRARSSEDAMEVEEYEAGKMTKGEADAGKGDQAGQSQVRKCSACRESRTYSPGSALPGPLFPHPPRPWSSCRPETQDSTEREEPEEETKPVTAIFNRVWSKQHPP